jgi:predicted transcriptional regulator
MTDLIKALSVALDRLSSIEETMNRLDRHSEMISRFNDRLDRFEARLTKAETKGGNVDVCIDEICALERKVHKLGVETHDQITVNHDFEIRLKTLEERTLDDPEFERLLERVVTLENDSGRWLETGDDLDSQIETVVERVLDRVLEDTLDSALSGREITVTL